MLLHLAGEWILALPLDLDGVVDGRQVTGGKLDVDDRSGDLDHLAGGLLGLGGGGRHGLWCLLVRQRAWAPDAISIISRVMLV